MTYERALRACPSAPVLTCVLLLGAGAAQAQATGANAPTREDSSFVSVAADVMALYLDAAGELWPGYDPAAMPLLLYLPGRWAMLLNPRGPADGYEDWPAGWPDPGAPALLRPGGIAELVGQLAFDYPAGADTTVAIPFMANLPPEMGAPREVQAAFIVHEQFHQHQRRVFADIDTPPEEPYPILDAENSALAALELRLVLEALDRLSRWEYEPVREAAGMLVGVRHERWTRLAPAMRRYERSKEIVEGTAKYVEVRGMERLAGVTPAAYLRRDGDSRLQDGALAPQDVPRNRIYPVGAGVGILLDAFGDRQWRQAAAAGDSAFTLLGRLEAALNLAADRLPGLAAQARERHDFPAVLAATERLKAEYLAGWEDAMAAFAEVPGLRLVIELPGDNLSRSRSSRERRWVVDEGARVFAANYLTYSLKRRAAPAFALRLTEMGVLEETVAVDPAAGRAAAVDELRVGTPVPRKRVTGRVARLEKVELDGRALDPAAAGSFDFSRITLEGPGLFLQSELNGSLRLSEGKVVVTLGI